MNNFIWTVVGQMTVAAIAGVTAIFTCRLAVDAMFAAAEDANPLSRLLEILNLLKQKKRRS